MILSQGSASDDGFKAGGSTVPTGTDLHAAEQFVMQVQNFAATHVLSLIDLLPSDPVPRGPTFLNRLHGLRARILKDPLQASPKRAFLSAGHCSIVPASQQSFSR